MKPKDWKHKSTPVFKIGDFGLCVDFDLPFSWDSPKKIEAMETLRPQGTPGYYAPVSLT